MISGFLPFIHQDLLGYLYFPYYYLFVYQGGNLYFCLNWDVLSLGTGVLKHGACLLDDKVISP